MEAIASPQRVLIVGAGPSGLMMACELARFGIPLMLIDKDLEKSPFSKAIGIQIRTLEIFSALGLFESLATQAHTVSSVEFFVKGALRAKLDLSKSSSFGGFFVVDQQHTEQVFERSLLAFEQKPIRGIELVDLVQDADGVDAFLKYGDGSVRSERFSYVVGADGAHSFVRKKMANQFAGESYDDAFILADAKCVIPCDHRTFRLFFRDKKFLAMIPMQGEHHYRLLSVRRGEAAKVGPMPAISEFQQLAKAVVPFSVEIKNETWVSRFFVQCRSASHYQEGRFFIAGDAAHIHSPAGGQGMNTGLQDSFNLAWKLAMVVKGMAPEKVLSTYHTERKPVGDFLIRRTDRWFKFMVKSSIWARIVRRVAFPYISRSSMLSNKLLTIVSQTAIRYQDGVICGDEDHMLLPDVKIGRRVPNVKLITSELKKTDLHSMVIGLCYSFVFFLPKNCQKQWVKKVTAATVQLSDDFGLSIAHHLIFASDFDAENLCATNYAVSMAPAPSFIYDQPFFIVVRPDHHVFCMGLLSELSHAQTELKKFLQ